MRGEWGKRKIAVVKIPRTKSMKWVEKECIAKRGVVKGIARLGPHQFF